MQYYLIVITFGIIIMTIIRVKTTIRDRFTRVPSVRVHPVSFIQNNKNEVLTYKALQEDIMKEYLTIRHIFQQSKRSLQSLAYPTDQPTKYPSSQPSARPSYPSMHSSIQPSIHPTNKPFTNPQSLPSVQIPTFHPSSHPSSLPSLQSSFSPTTLPYSQPSRRPSQQPIRSPTIQPLRPPSEIRENQRLRSFRCLSEQLRK
jgi:hypothetical protein